MIIFAIGRNKKLILSAGVVIFVVLLLIGWIWWNFLGSRITNLPPAVPVVISPTAEDKIFKEAPLAAIVAKNLEVPWALDFLPDGSIIFTERAGRIRLLDAKKGLLSEPLLTIEGVARLGEGGLLGIAVHPDFAKNRFIYVYYTYQNGKNLANKVVRFTLQNFSKKNLGGFREKDKNLVDKKIIIDNIPGNVNHNGGRIKFGPDGRLYIATGDALIPDLAQDKNSLAGKILRLTDDGIIPANNPFPNSPIYSFGHRNPQGLAWDDQGRLWATEHGAIATDELNLIEPGKNYGWPIIRGDEKTEGFEAPIIQSGRETWAPSGTAFLEGSIFFAGLRGQSLYEVKTKEEKISFQQHFYKKFGRLRDVVLGRDGFLYLLISNRDGRGLPIPDDDQIIRINPKKL